MPSLFSGCRGGTHPLAVGPVKPRPLPRPGRSDRQRRRVPQKPGPGRQIVSKDNPSGVSRIGGQAGTQAPDPTPTPPQNRGSRAGSTTNILPADYALPVDGGLAGAKRHGTSQFGCAARRLQIGPAGRAAAPTRGDLYAAVLLQNVSAIGSCCRPAM